MHHTRPNFKKNTGFTLLELMVSEAIAVILITGLLAFIAPSVAAINHVKSNSDIQDSSRLGFEYLQNAVAYAGYQGCETTRSHTSIIDVSHIDISPRLRHWAYQSFGLQGFGANEDERIISTLGASWRNAQYRYGQHQIGDLLIVQYPEGPALTLEEHDPAGFRIIFKGRLTESIRPGQLIQLNDCNHSARVQVNPEAVISYSRDNHTTTISYAPVDSINCNGRSAPISLGPDDTEGCTSTEALEGNGLFQFETGTRGHIVNSEAYYIGYDAAARAPALKRSGFASNSARVYTETIVEGIENMRFQYGVDTDDDGIPDHYMSAAHIDQESAIDATITWPNVVNLRIWLLVRSSAKTETNTAPSPLFFPSTNGQKIDCRSSPDQGEQEYQQHFLACPFSASDPKQYDRRVITQVVSLENRNS